MTSQFGRVGVLYGGHSAEREISLMSGQAVYEALTSLGIDAHRFDTGRQNLAQLAAANFARVFIALHGRYGEDGTIQGALELLNIPYTGSSMLASALAMNKGLTKRLWLQQGLPTPAFALIDTETDLHLLPDRLGLPLILKPPHEGSSLGMTKVACVTDLVRAYQHARRYDTVILAEKFIPGPERTVTILVSCANSKPLPVVARVAPDGDYDYKHKYFSDATQYFCPANLPVAVASQVAHLAEQAYCALGCTGWGRVDFMLDAQLQPWLLEINTAPGMTAHSLAPMAAKVQGMHFPQLCVQILAQATCHVHNAADTP
jgi:D-alanine-D-alanine ligase